MSHTSSGFVFLPWFQVVDKALVSPMSSHERHLYLLSSFVSTFVPTETTIDFQSFSNYI